MYKPIHAFLDNRFNIQQQHEYDLIISLSEGSVRFIGMGDAKVCLLAEAYDLQNIHAQDAELLKVQKIFHDHPLIAKGSWRKILCIIANQWYTLVPTPLYIKESIADYLRLAVDFVQEEMSLRAHKTEYNATVVFAIYSAMIDWLNDIYPSQNLCIIPQSSAIITSAQFYLHAKKLTSIPQVFVVTERMHMDITFIDHTNLIYYNRFEYATGDDWIQNILTVMHALALKPEVNRVILAGYIVKNSVVYKKLCAYVRNIAFVEKPNALRMRCSSKQENFIHYFELFNAYLSQER